MDKDAVGLPEVNNQSNDNDSSIAEESPHSDQKDYPDFAILSRGRRRKGADEYATEYKEDFSSTRILLNGINKNVLICKFCSVKIGARSDRIKEHLSSKRHIKLKAAFMESGERIDVGNRRSRGMKRGTVLASRRNPRASSSRSGFPQNIWEMRVAGIQLNGGMTTGTGEFLNTPQPWPSTSAGVGIGTESRSLVKNEDIEITVSRGRVGQPRAELDYHHYYHHRHHNLSSSTSTPSASSTPSPVMSYHLKWESHGKIFRNAFIDFKAQEHLTDVILVSGSNMIKCHKVVLSACSDYFINIFKEHPYAYPITIVLNPRIFSELKTLVNFMYYGEAVVSKEGLKPLLKTAEQLGIWGLTPGRVPVPFNSRMNGASEDGNPPGEVIDMSLERKDVRKSVLPTEADHGETSTGYVIKSNQEPSFLPGLLPLFESPPGGNVGLDLCKIIDTTKAKLNDNNNDTGPATLGTSSGFVPVTPLWNTSLSTGPRDGNITSLVNDAVLMVTGTGVENPLSIRKRKLLPKPSTVTSEILRNEQWQSCENGMKTDLNQVDLKRYRTILPKIDLQIPNMAGFQLGPETSIGQEAEKIPGYANSTNSSPRKVNGAQEQEGYFTSGNENEQRESYTGESDTASCSSGHISDGDGADDEDRDPVGWC